MNRETYTDSELIAMIKSSRISRNTALRWICSQESWVGGCHKVASLSGVRAEYVEDIFQSALTAMTMNILTDKYNGSSKLRTYLISISKYKSLNWRRKERIHLPLESTHSPSIDPESLSSFEKQQVLEGLMRRAFSGLKDDCKKILTMYGLGTPMEEIAIEMGFLNKQSAKNKSKKCRDKLKEIIRSDSNLYNELKSFL